MFDLDPPHSIPEKRRSGRNRKFTDPLTIDPKGKKILTALLRSKRLGGGGLWETYPSYDYRLFSPLLVLEISLPERQINIDVIQTVRDFLPFLCNSIFLV